MNWTAGFAVLAASAICFGGPILIHEFMTRRLRPKPSSDRMAVGE